MAKPVPPPGALDSVMQTLSHRHSRAVCRYFGRHSTETVSFEDLVEFVHEQDGRDTDRASVRIHLHHATLPKLAAAGFVDYDHRSRTVQCREPDVVDAWLRYVVGAKNAPL